MRPYRKQTSDSDLYFVVMITAIVYFLYYYLQIYTVVIQDPRDCLYETWLLVAEPRLPAPLDAFELVIYLLAAWLLTDFLRLYKTQGHFKNHQLFCYVAVLGCLGYWGFSIYKFNEYFMVENGEIARLEYLQPQTRQPLLNNAYVPSRTETGALISVPVEDYLSEPVCGQGVEYSLTL